MNKKRRGDEKRMWLLLSQVWSLLTSVFVNCGVTNDILADPASFPLHPTIGSASSSRLFLRFPAAATTILPARRTTTATTKTTSGGTMSSSSKAQARHENTSSGFVPRYNGPQEDEMTPEQIKIRDAIVASRPRTGLSGPFGPWLAVPGIAQPAQALGRACRYDTSLSFFESELVILLTGAKMRSHAEFDIHVGEAIKAGWSAEQVNAIPRDDEFGLAAVKQRLVPKLNDDRQKSIAIFAAELLETCTVSDETYERTKIAVGNKDSVLVEITSIVGYYAYVSYTLNVFRIPSSSSSSSSSTNKKEGAGEEDNNKKKEESSSDSNKRQKTS